MRRFFAVICAALAIPAGTAGAANMELAYVSRTIATDGAIIVMEDGQAFRIAKTTGCLAFTGYEGSFVLIYSPNGYLQKDQSEIILLGDDQRCRITFVRPLGYYRNDVTVRSARMRGFTPRELQTLCEAALKELGYGIVVVDGEVNDELTDAVTEFQRANGIRASGELGPVTMLAIAGQIHRVYAGEPGTLAVGAMILRAASRALKCDNDWKIHKISDDSRVLHVSGERTLRIREQDLDIVEGWAEGDYVRVCSHVVYNVDAGQVAALEKKE